MPDRGLPADADRLALAVHRLSRSLQPLIGETGTTLPQVMLLAMVLDHGPMRITDLAELIPCSQPAATVIVARLEARGLLSRRPDLRDRRAALIELTEQGLEEFRRLRRVRTATLLARLSRLEPEDREQLLRALPILEQLAAEPPPQASRRRDPEVAAPTA